MPEEKPEIKEPVKLPEIQPSVPEPPRIPVKPEIIPKHDPVPRIHPEEIPPERRDVFS